MLLNRKHIAPAAVSLLLALSGTALIAGAGTAGSGSAGCEILATSAGGMITLEGVVYAKTAMTGSYRFRIASVGGSGNSNISQGGAFSAGPGQPAKLGRAMLGGSGAVYEATLEVESPAGRLTCSERAGAL